MSECSYYISLNVFHPIRRALWAFLSPGTMFICWMRSANEAAPGRKG